MDKLVSGLTERQPILASSGEEGLRLILQERPDLVILSAQLSDMSGLRILRTLRQRDENVPVILTTADESEELAVQAFRSGACDYVKKPCSSQEMREAIRRALATARSHEEREHLTQQLLKANRRLQRQLQELNAIHAIGRMSTSLLDLDEVLNRITEVAVYMTDATESMLLLLDSKNNELYPRTVKNVDQRVAHNLRMPADNSAAGRALQTDRPVLLTGSQAKSGSGYSAEAILHVPLRVPERGSIGVLSIASQEAKDAFSEADIFLLSILVDYAAIAIENARLFEDISSAKTLMDNVFASINSGVITIDTQNRTTFLNRAAKHTLQVSTSLTVGVPLDDLLPTLEAKLRTTIEAVKKQGESEGPLEIDISIPDRGLINLRTSLSPLKDASGKTRGVALVIEDITEQRRLESRYQLFQRYLSPAVIERLPNDPYKLKLGGQQREITCLFADLRSFVNFSLQHSPDVLVNVLNQHLAAGANAILTKEGTLDKFMGDAIVAFFNAPLSQTNHPLRAAQAALNIREEISKLHKHLPPSYRLDYGIGISTGDAVVGNVGTSQRVDYTAIGPSVNLARRLQEAAAPGQILLSSTTYQRIKEHVKVRSFPLEEVKGLNKRVQAYELIQLL